MNVTHSVPILNILEVDLEIIIIIINNISKTKEALTKVCGALKSTKAF